MSADIQIPSIKTNQINKPFFTIVIIACNVGDYLQECIESVLAQNFKDFDILIGVEDSTDATAEIADSYAQKNSNVNVYKFRKSGSASFIRNFGIKNAAGQYLLFVDGDDWIEQDSLQKFHDKIQEFGSLDLIPAAATKWEQRQSQSPSSPQPLFYGSYPQTLLTGQEYLLKACPITKLRTATWICAYRTAFLRDAQLYQCVGRRHQDDEWTPRVYFYAKKISTLKFQWYNYRVRKGSITTVANPKSMIDIADNIGSFFNFWGTSNMPTSLKPSFANWYIDYTIRFFGSHSAKIYDSKLRRECFMRAVGNEKEYTVFKDVSKWASPAKRALRPIYALARTKYGFKTADVIYTYIYAPVVFKLWAGVVKICRNKGFNPSKS